MKITVICTGSLKEKFWRDALAEYQKRMTSLADFRIIELKEAKGDTVASTLQKEGSEIMKHLPPRAYKIALCIEGKEIDSPALSEIFSKKSLEGINEFVFIIGSSHGIAEDVKKMCDLCLSFSRLTFPHQLFRVMLAEQIYRAFTIINNTGYHK